MGVLFTIGITLLALFAAGLLFTLVVKLTTSVGRFIIKRINDFKKKVAMIRLKKMIDAMKREAQNEKDTENANKMLAELGSESIASWLEDENSEVIEDSIVLIKGEQVDKKTRSILDDNNGSFVISPTVL